MSLYPDVLVTGLKTIATNTTLTSSDVRHYGCFYLSDVVTLTLPQPSAALVGRSILVGNAGASASTVACNNGFLRDADSVSLAAGATMELRCMKITTSTYRWYITGHTQAWTDYTDWTTWTPTAVWSDAAPASVTTVARYHRLGNIVDFVFEASGADGDGKTPTSFTLPVTPKDINALVFCSGWQLVNTTESNCGAYVDANDNTAGNRKLYFKNASACTDTKAWRISVTGRYEVAAS